jgi:hypothetical protein
MHEALRFPHLGTCLLGSMKPVTMTCKNTQMHQLEYTFWLICFMVRWKGHQFLCTFGWKPVINKRLCSSSQYGAEFFFLGACSGAFHRAPTFLIVIRE